MKTQVANPTLADLLDRHTAVGSLWHREDDRIRCVACGHRCLIGDGKRGICKVRYSEDGQLKVPFGYVAALQCDPVEKKPFFHVYPGSDALTFGMMGCDLHCSYCQNWVTSQALRDAAAVAPVRPVTPAQLVEGARREGARLVVSSYNEPLITAEWAVAVFEEARAAGLACAFVSNGNATPEVLDFLRPWIVAYKVDLKTFEDRHYRSLGGMLDNITDTIRMIHARGIWLEVVTLIIPGFNDSEAELRDMAQFLASVDRDIPWHVTAFHKDYRMTDPDATSPRTLMRAAEIGTEAGLRFIYAGNLPGRVGPWENALSAVPRDGDRTVRLPDPLVSRDAGRLLPSLPGGMPGVWPAGAVQTGNDRNAYARRLPRPVQSLPLVEIREPSPSSSGSVSPMATSAASPPRSELTAQQKEQLIGVAGDLVRTAAVGQTPALDPAALGGLGAHMVAGAFVSLKRGKHLRGCCGMLGRPIPLGAALVEAASRTVWEDVRFPPVSPTEVEHLHIELWVLHDPEPVQARGLDRAAAITIGRHGIQVARGQQHALFLPGVALDNEWDSRQFLDQVCIKAGMHPTAWHDDATTLSTFEGEVVRARLSEVGASRMAPARRPGVCGPHDLGAYADLCRNNIVALLIGATPNYFFFGAPDGNVSGAVLTLQMPTPAGPGEAVHISQISLRPGVPLQSTLFSLCQNAAQTLSRQALTSESLAQLKVSVTILHDPVLHGTAHDSDLAGVDASERALLVMERNKSSVVFDPARQPAELLREAASQAKVTHPAGAAVFSLDALALAPLTLTTAPRPVRGPAVRAPGAAGSFYPADATQLARLVDSLMQGDPKAERWPAALLPHAGLVYSGRIAANVLRHLEIPRRVIVIGPKHTPHGMDWAVAPHQTWTFPGGSLESDFILARRLAEAIDGLELDAAAHQREHAVEVELPLLARLAPETRVVGIAIGAGDLASCRRFADGLAAVLRECEDRPLLLISSDMNHYATDAENRRLDALALDALERLDPGAVYETVTRNHISMCGILPAVIVLETLQRLGGLTRARRLDYATSADVSGDTSRVVGYAGMLFA